jgi:hypothetical protein
MDPQSIIDNQIPISLSAAVISYLINKKAIPSLITGGVVYGGIYLYSTQFGSQHTNNTLVSTLPSPHQGLNSTEASFGKKLNFTSDYKGGYSIVFDTSTPIYHKRQNITAYGSY